jgi:integrase
LAKIDIDLVRGEILIRKGKSKAAKRTLDMTSESRKILERRMAGDSPWIFPSVRKRGCQIGRINSAHDTVVAEAAKEGVIIDWVPYDFRHTFATRIAQGGKEGGVDLVTLAALLGHESIHLVKKYVHPTAEHKRAAMERYDRMKRDSEESANQKPRKQSN